MTAFYSTPAAYIDAKSKEQISWELKQDDFFPYSDNPHSFWTGDCMADDAQGLQPANGLVELCIMFIHRTCLAARTVIIMRFDNLSLVH